MFWYFVTSIVSNAGHETSLFSDFSVDRKPMKIMRLKDEYYIKCILLKYLINPLKTKHFLIKNAAILIRLYGGFYLFS